MKKLPTLRDIAREAGVSVSAVSHAFNRPGELSTEARERILAVARELGYVPDPRARALRRGESRLVALIVTNLANPYYSAIAYAAQQALVERGYYLVVLSSNGTLEGERRCLEAVRNERMAGAIADLHHLAPDEAVARLQHTGAAALVLIGDQTEALRVPCVRVQNFAAAYEAVGYLARRERRRIAHITGPLDAGSGAQRRAGYRQALRDLGLGDPVEAAGDYLFASGQRAMEALLELAGEARPDAVFAGNDLMALGALAVARERGVRVPDAIAILGFDDIDESARSVPPLTTIAQPTTRIGEAAARLLLAALAQSGAYETVDVACHLVERGSA